MAYTLHPATEADARELAPVLRAPDRDEVLAMLGPAADPADGLLASLATSREAWTARDADGRIICMAGICPASLIGRVGIPWLLGSDLVPAHRRAFMVETRRQVERWQGMFPVLRNLVDARYAAAIRWLRWLRFEIGEPVPFAHGTFRPFHREA